MDRIRVAILLIDQYEPKYESWSTGTSDALRPELTAREDEIRRQVRLAADVARAMGEPAIADRLVEHSEGAYGGHPWQQARKALVEMDGVLAHREELAAILGPQGPQLSVSSMNPTIWSAAAALWDDGHRRQAVQTAGQALEGLMQARSGTTLSGKNLGVLFSNSPPASGQPRLRVQGVEEGTPTWTSVHEGAAGLVRGAMMAVRNLVSHPGWPDPTEGEGLEMLAVLSYVAHLVERCDLEVA